MSRPKALYALTAILLTGCVEPGPVECFPEANGDKPEAFELGFVQVCERRSDALAGTVNFARRYDMLQERITEPEERIAAAYSSGAPMREHLMVERLHEKSYRVGISTLRGYPTDRVLAARAFDFCGNA